MSRAGRYDPVAGVQPRADDVRLANVLRVQAHRRGALRAQVRSGQAALVPLDLNYPGAVQRHDQHARALVAGQLFAHRLR